MTRTAIALSWCVAVSACATIPDVTYTYHLPKSSTALSATQTLNCPTPDQLVITTTITQPVTTYSANPDRARSFSTNDFKGFLSDTDVTVGLYDDGRLKSINAAVTGQAETILKSVISLASALVPLVGAHIAEAPSPCSVIAKWAGEKKAATLTYTANVSFDKMKKGDVVTLNPDIDNAILVSDHALFDNIKRQLPEIIVAVAEVKEIDPVVLSNVDRNKSFSLDLQKTANMRLDFFACEKACPKSDKTDKSGDAMYDYSAAKWAGAAALIVPERGFDLYPLYVPKGEPFGGAKFAITLSEAGGIQSLQYAKTSGAAGVMNVATSAITAAAPAPGTTPPPPPGKPTNATGAGN